MSEGSGTGEAAASAEAKPFSAGGWRVCPGSHGTDDGPPPPSRLWVQEAHVFPELITTRDFYTAAITGSQQQVAAAQV